ncbi:MAG: glycosyltransferase family 39 protein, partial [Huintestinicola sp.]
MFLTKIKKYFKENLVLIILFLIASIIECAVIFPIMMNDSINYDSTYQYGLTQHTIPEIFRLLPYDYSPPFYAIALKLFTMVFGNSLAVMRTFSIFAVIGMLWAAAFPMKRIFGEKAAYTCLIITFFSFAVLSMIHEIRPTIFAMFFFMAVSVFAVEAYMLGKRSSYICFTFFAVLAMYTHNIALVGTFSVYVSLLLVSLIEKDFIKFRNFLLSGIICAVLYIPWLSVLLSQISHVKDNFWVSPDGILNNIEWTLMNPFKSFHLNPLTKILILLMEICILFAFLRHINIKKIKT